LQIRRDLCGGIDVPRKKRSDKFYAMEVARIGSHKKKLSGFFGALRLAVRKTERTVCRLDQVLQEKTFAFVAAASAAS